MNEEDIEEDIEEDEALTQLSLEELEKFLHVASVYLEKIDDKETLSKVSPACNFNLNVLSENLPKVKYGYYEGFEKKLQDVLTLLLQILDVEKDEDTKELIQDCISKIKDFYERFNLPYQKYYQKYPYKYKYPYNPKDRLERAKEIQQEIIADKINQMKDKEDRELKQSLEKNLLPDLIIKSGGYFGDKQTPTYTDEMERTVKMGDANQRILDACERIKKDIQEERHALKEWQEQMQKIAKREQQLSNDEQKLSEFRKKLLDKAVDAILSQEE
jgi:hypothetical protein